MFQEMLNATTHVMFGVGGWGKLSYSAYAHKYPDQYIAKLFPNESEIILIPQFSVKIGPQSTQ